MASLSAAAREPASSIEGELLVFFARMGSSVPASVLLVMGFVAYMASRHVGWLWPALWLCVLFVWLPLRASMMARLPTPEKALHRRRLVLAGVLSAVNAFLYGSSVMFFPYLPETERAILTLIVMGLCTGVMSASAGYMPLYGFYLAAMIGSIALAWLINPGRAAPGWDATAVSVLMMLYGLFLVSSARNTFATFRESFENRQRLSTLNGQLEAALSRAESANQAKTRFLASASHDLRQPVHTLSLFNAALSLQSLSGRQRELVESQAAAVAALAAQLDALLDISKLDAGMMKARTAPVDLRRMIQRLAEEFDATCHAKGLRLVTECEGRAWLHTDASMLERILRNLLSNAVKYTDEGEVRLGAELNNVSPRITVSDTGCGVPETEQVRIFDEFFQLHNPERDRNKGLGLGLAIVRRLAEALGLSVRFHSQPGTGTRVDLSLPAAFLVPAEEEPIAPPVSQETGTTLAGLNVLVLDDEAAVGAAMQALLEALGCEVQLAESTVSALNAARIARPDLVLADIRLRGEDDGIQALRALRKEYPGLPALLISGDTAPARLREAQAAGLPLLHKPVSADRLKQEISALVGGEPLYVDSLRDGPASADD